MKAGARGMSETPPEAVQTRATSRQRGGQDVAWELFPTAVCRYRAQRATQKRAALPGYLC